MEVASNPSDTPQRRLTSKVAWIPPACGLFASIVATLIGRSADWEYRHEASMAVFFVVSTLVGGYYTGRLATRPGFIIGLAVLFGVIGAAITHW